MIDPNPATSQRLYFGTFRVWQTQNGGNTWSAISQDLSNQNPSNFVNGLPTDDITSISVSPLDSNVVYAGTFQSLVWRTTNASAGVNAIWTQFVGNNPANPMLPLRAITEVAADPNNRDTVFVTMSGFIAVRPGCAERISWLTLKRSSSVGSTKPRS